MKKSIINMFLAAAAVIAVSSCSEVDLPPLPDGVESDINKIPLPPVEGLEIPLKDESVPMIKNYGLHTEEDFVRIREKLKAGAEPWVSAKRNLDENWMSGLGWIPYPTEYLIRGGGAENYQVAMKNTAAAYMHALRYHIGDGEQYGIEAIKILDSWARNCKEIGGDTNSALGAGLYGYQFAVDGCLMRDLWMKRDPDGFKNFQDWMIRVFYVRNSDFLTGHWGTVAGHYWANWGLCNIASMAAIGIVCDRRDIYNEAIEHFQIGETNGCLNKAIYHAFTEDEFDGKWTNFAQWQENVRDIGHSVLCQGLVGIICQLCWNQGDDFFAFNDNRFLKGCEYHGAWLTAGIAVPSVPYLRNYQSPWGPAWYEHEGIVGRGDANGAANIWALPYNHYKHIKGMSDDMVKYTKMGRDVSPIEGGGGGNRSGAYDMLGFGTLMYTIEY